MNFQAYTRRKQTVYAGVRTFRRQTLHRQCRTFDREDVGEDVGVVECGLYTIVCVGETSDIVGVTSVGETSAPLYADSDIRLEERGLSVIWTSTKTSKRTSIIIYVYLEPWSTPYGTSQSGSHYLTPARDKISLCPSERQTAVWHASPASDSCLPGSSDLNLVCPIRLFTVSNEHDKSRNKLPS